jgi:hypothetical protein
MNLAIGDPQFAPNATTHCDMAKKPGAVTDVTSMQGPNRLPMNDTFEHHVPRFRVERLVRDPSSLVSNLAADRGPGSSSNKLCFLILTRPNRVQCLKG